MRPVLALFAGIILLGSPLGAALSDSPESAVETTQATGPASRAPGCEAEAQARALSGPARAAFLGECAAAKATASAPPSVPGAGPDKRRVRPSRQECRTQASKIRHLWGLARHKFIKRCRAGRVPLPSGAGR